MWTLVLYLSGTMSDTQWLFPLQVFTSLRMEGSFRETRHLKDLLLVNLDLIQRQQELLAEKDKRIQHLLHENDSVRLTFVYSVFYMKFYMIRYTNVLHVLEKKTDGPSLVCHMTSELKLLNNNKLKHLLSELLFFSDFTIHCAFIVCFCLLR